MLVWISGTPLELDAGLRARRGGTCSDRIISSRASFEKGYRMNLVPIAIGRKDQIVATYALVCLRKHLNIK